MVWRTILAAAVLALAATAQNSTAYNAHVLHNGFDGLYFGVGAGGSTTRTDGLGTWIPGETMRGPTLATLSGDFAYKQLAWRAHVCPLTSTVAPGLTWVQAPLVTFIEFDGGNGHDPQVYTTLRNPLPSCGSTWPSVFAPYGIPSGSTVSFVLGFLPSGVAPTVTILLPNEGPTLGTSSNFLAAIASSLSVGPVPTGCYSLTMSWITSSIASMDKIDGWWHYAQNGSSLGQYFGMSFDELNLWRSRSIATASGQTVLLVFTAEAEYALSSGTVAPQTAMTLLPNAHTGAGLWDTQTANVVNEAGLPASNPHGGFDIGGHNTISMSGTGGVLSLTTGLSPQDPAFGGFGFGTLGFATFDNGGDGNGSKRLTWIGVDYDTILNDAFGPFPPELQPNVTVQAGTVRLPQYPMTSTPVPFPQPDTLVLFPFFGHETTFGWPAPRAGCRSRCAWPACPR